MKIFTRSALRPWSTKPFLWAFLVVAILAILSVYAWHLLSPSQVPIRNPFDFKMLASLNFPIYYPSYLPRNYSIDSTSVTEPQPGVVVLTIRGPKQPIFMSEEARIATFNYGGYYNQFEHLKETVTKNGVIAVGYVSSGRTAVGSLVTSKTWILIDSSAPLPLSQLTTLLNNLVVAH